MRPGVRDIAVLATRILMSSTPLWIVVEGRYHDRAYYDKLMRSIPSIASMEYEIILAEFTSIENIAAGGKTHALRLHEELSRNSWLRQSNQATPHVVLFALDRDLDMEPQNTDTDSLHIIYTKYSDVEAEILIAGDLREALVAVTGTTIRDVSSLPYETLNPLSFLAQSWEEWLVWGLALRDTNPNPLPHRTASLINDSYFGPLNTAAQALHLKRICTIVGEEDWKERLSAARELFTQLERQQKTGRLVGGKWAYKYVTESVKTHMAETGLPADLEPVSITRAMLTLLSIPQSNKNRYAKRIATLFVEAKSA